MVFLFQEDCLRQIPNHLDVLNTSRFTMVLIQIDTMVYDGFRKGRIHFPNF